MMKRLFQYACVALLSTLYLSSPTHAQQCQPASDSVIQEISQIWQGHVDGHLIFDVEAAADLYDREMIWRSPDGIATMTKEGLIQSYHKWYARLQSEGGRIINLSYVTDRALQCGDVILEMGHWSVKTGTDATPKIENWEHSVIWMRNDIGALKIQSVINWKMPE